MFTTSIGRVAAAGLVALLGLVGSALPAAAQDDYPNQPIKVVVPFAAGGGTDVITRIWADAVGESLNQRILVENMPGAAGATGTRSGIAAAPDGYTLTAGVASSMAINPHIMADLGYTADDLEGVAMLTFSPWMMVVSAQLPVNSVEELIAYNAEHPGELTFASWTATGEMGRKVFALRSGVELLPVPYEGSVAAMTDLVAGRADVALLDISAAVPFIDAGEVRPIAMTSSQRTDLLPDVPSITEAGVENYDVTSWVALFAPKGTPEAIIAKLNDATNEAFKDPEIVARFQQLGSQILDWEPAEVEEFVASENAKWRAMAEETGALAN